MKNHTPINPMTLSLVLNGKANPDLFLAAEQAAQDEAMADPAFVSQPETYAFLAALSQMLGKEHSFTRVTEEEAAAAARILSFRAEERAGFDPSSPAAAIASITEGSGGSANAAALLHKAQSMLLGIRPSVPAVFPHGKKMRTAFGWFAAQANERTVYNIDPFVEINERPLDRHTLNFTQEGRLCLHHTRVTLAEPVLGTLWPSVLTERRLVYLNPGDGGNAFKGATDKEIAAGVRTLDTIDLFRLQEWFATHGCSGGGPETSTEALIHMVNTGKTPTQAYEDMREEPEF